MTKAEQILSLVSDDLSVVHNELFDIFKEENILYVKLKNEYMESPNNFNYVEYCKRLKVFIYEKREYINCCYKDKIFCGNNEFSDEDYYQSLCKLDFKDQKDYFDNIIQNTEKQLIPFVLRAEGSFGQRWLYNRLIHEYSIKYPTHTALTVHLSQPTVKDLHGFLDDLAIGVGVEGYEKHFDIEYKKTRLKFAIFDRLESMSQFIIVHDAHSFISLSESENAGFDEFCSFLINLDIEIKFNKRAIHKCIFLFIENTPDPYKIEHFICATQIRARKARQEKTVKFIGLHAIKKLESQHIETWLDTAIDHICNCFEEANDIEKLISTHNGHPEKIIPAICEKIGIDYEQNINKWLKY